MKNNYTYKTQRGSEVKLTVEIIHITEEENVTDHNFSHATSKYKYEVSSITVGGKEYTGTFANLAYDIKVGQHGCQPILVAVPSEIIEDFKTDERIEAEANIERFTAAEKEYQEHKAMMEKAMNM